MAERDEIGNSTVFLPLFRLNFQGIKIRFADELTGKVSPGKIWKTNRSKFRWILRSDEARCWSQSSI